MEKQSTDHHPIENIDAELTGIIYEAALDPNLWPDLMEMLILLFNQQDNSNHCGEIDDDVLTDVGDGTEEEQRYLRLLPHFHRALAINRHYNDKNQEQLLTNSIIDQLPIGVVVINAEGEIVSLNRRAEEVIHGKLGISVENNIFCIENKLKNSEFNRYIHNLTNRSISSTKKISYSLTINQQDQTTLSLLITADPYYHGHYDGSADRRVTLFIASPFGRYPISLESLQSLLQLTPAETRLAASLANGTSIEEAALENNITKHTAKTHLKNIFQKTGTHKQAELVKLILTSPAALAAPEEYHPASKTDCSTQSLQCLLNEELLTLSDGRKLCFCEYGDKQGVPVFYFHGILGSRYERHPNDRVTKDLGIRLIVLDRPGYGRSDANTSGSYLEFVDDVVQLADHLNINCFSVFGLSAGSIYAAACAYKIPERILSTTLASITLPLRSFADVANLLPTYKMHFAFTRYLPKAARLFSEIAIRNARSNPTKFFRNIPVSPVDRKILFREELHQHLVKSLLAGCKESHYGFVEDVMSSAQAWPFPVEEIKIKLDFWHGTEDVHSPIHRIYELVDCTINGHIFPIQDNGHFFIYDHWSDILKTIIRNSKNHC